MSSKKRKRKKSVKKRVPINKISFDIGSELQKAVRYHQSGKLQKAEGIYKKIIEIDPFHSDSLHLLGVIAHQIGKNDVASTLINKAILNNPECPLYYYNLAKALKAQGKLDSAISAYRKVIELKPDDAETYLAMGNAHQSQNQTEDALLCYQMAIQIKPDYVDAYNNLGTVLKDQGRLDEAISCYQTALRLKPDDHEVQNNLGVAFKEQGKLSDALACYEKALQLKPNYADAYNNIGIALKDEGHLSDAIACYRKALSLKPNMVQTYNNLGVALKDQGQLDEAVSCYHKALTLQPDYESAHSNLLFGLHHSTVIDPVQLFDQHKLWAKKHAEPLSANIPAHRNDKRLNRPLRIGYVSPDFRAHSVAYFMESLLETHDRSAFQIFCYSDVATQDSKTAHFKDLAGCWRDILGISDEHAAGLVRNDQIDILVDLAGHTAKNRMLLFARKPAPVQVAYLGYPNTTGLQTMDYRITDSWADPPDQTDHLYTEELVRIPHGFLCYTPYKEAPVIASLPAQESDCVTFGSFNNRSKITPEVVRVWSQILNSVPNARLVLKSKSLSDIETQNMLREMFIENGVSPELIKFLGYSPSSYEHLSSYNSIDIGLDTFPYNGTTTTCEAMWMGVPVIVPAGTFHMSRVGVSLLSNVGLADLIGDSNGDYIEKAVKLAGDLERLKKIRSGLRDMMLQSPLMDARLFTYSLEKGYRTMWKHYVKKENKGSVAGHF